MAKKLPPGGGRVTRDEYNRLAAEINAPQSVDASAGNETWRLPGVTLIAPARRYTRERRSTGSNPNPIPDTVETGSFFAIIQAVIPTATSTRWTYTATRLKKHIQGEGATTWEADPRYEASYEAFNLYECINSEAGVQGNGVDISGADFPATMAVMPCPVGSIVRVWTVAAEDATTEYWFAHANAIDGTCE